MEKPKFFKHVYSRTFRELGANFQPLVRVLAIPYLLVFALEWLLLEELSAWEGLVVVLAYVAATAAIAIAIHRVVLLGESSLPAWGVIFNWTRRETRFLGYYFLITLLLMSFLLPLLILVHGKNPGQLSVVALVWFFVFLYIVSRLSLVLPAVATDEPMTLRAAWRASSKHKGMLVAAVLTFPFLFNAIKKSLAFTDIPQIAYVPIIDLLVLVLSVIALSVSWRLIKQYNLATEKGAGQSQAPGANEPGNAGTSP